MWGVCFDVSLLNGKLFHLVIQYELVNDKTVVNQPYIGDNNIASSKLRDLSSSPEFEYGETVRVANHPNIIGTVQSIYWHFNNKKFYYFICVEGKKLKRRYYAEDLIKI